MPRVLVCLDAQPAQDGSCQTTAWIEQPSLVDMLPTVEQANIVGPAFVLGLCTLAALGLLNPRDRDED